MFKEQIAKFQEEINNRRLTIEEHYKYKTYAFYIKGQEEAIEDLLNRIMFLEQFN